MIHADPDLKQHIVNLHIQQGRTFASLSDEFGYSRSIISKWVKEYRLSAQNDIEKAKFLADMEELQALRKQVAELEKENDFLKKAAAFFAKESK